MKILLTLIFFIWTLESTAQIISLTPQSSSYQITTNTTFVPGTPGIKTFIVCPGVTLSYSESSTMDTIILLSGSKLIFDSIFSYGYSRVYAQSGSTVDMNFKQTGSLTYEAGVTILDTNVGPPSFFQGSQQVNTIQVSYTNLLGGVSACTPLGIQDINLKGETVILSVVGNTLSIQSVNSVAKSYSIINTQGQKILKFSSKDNIVTQDISALPSGMYWLKWKSNSSLGVVAFIK